jgi:hypothetical protein
MSDFLDEIFNSVVLPCLSYPPAPEDKYTIGIYFCPKNEEIECSIQLKIIRFNHERSCFNNKYVSGYNCIVKGEESIDKWIENKKKLLKKRAAYEYNKRSNITPFFLEKLREKYTYQTQDLVSK